MSLVCRTAGARYDGHRNGAAQRAAQTSSEVMATRYLVTGGAGFIGSHLVDRLLGDGHDVVVVDSFEPFYGRELKEANLATAVSQPRFRLVEATISSLAGKRPSEGGLSDLVGWAEVVVHLAAQAGVRSSWGASFDTYIENNIRATQLLLEACRDAEVGRFIYASSSSVYGDTDDLPMREGGVCSPTSPYGVTKLTAEHLARVYWGSFGVPTVSLRFFSVYGPRQRPDMAFRRFFEAIRAGRPIEVYGGGVQRRDFTYVGDIIDGLMASIDAAPGSVYNLGGGSEVTLNDAIAVLAGVVGSEPAREVRDAQPGDARETWASIERAQRDLGYRPQVSLDEGLRAEWDWLNATV